LDLSANRLTSFPTEILKQLEVLETLNLSHNRIQSVDEWNSPSLLPSTLIHLNLSNNKIEDVDQFALVLAAGACPRLQLLSFANNYIQKIPYTLGLLAAADENGATSTTTLQFLDFKGNPQQAVRYEVLEKPCLDQLHYLLQRLTSEQVVAAKKRMAEIQSGSGGGGKLNPSQPAQQNDATAVTTPSTAHTADSNKAAPAPPPVEKTNEPEETPSNKVAAVATMPATLDSNEPPPTTEEKPREVKETSLIPELTSNIQDFESQLENLSLSQAKHYALKKSLAMERFKLIREERRLGLRK
jgi:hypothetical protein